MSIKCCLIFSGASVHDRGSSSSTPSRLALLETVLAANVEQLRTKELSERETQKQIEQLQDALEHERNQTQQRIEQIEEMAEREKQRVLKHLQEEKRFTRDIIQKSETMIDQLKRELSSERKRKTDEQKTNDALRDIYRKMTPRQGRSTSKVPRDDHDDDEQQSCLDGETTVYHKDDPLLASTPRDRSLLTGRNENGDSRTFHRQLEDRLKDENDDLNDESLFNEQKTSSNLTTGPIRSRLPPAPKRSTNITLPSSVSSSYDKAQPTIIKLDPTSHGKGN